MMGTALGIGSSQLGQPNLSGALGQGYTQQPQWQGQPLQHLPFGGYSATTYPLGGQIAQYAPPQQIQQLLHILPQQLQQLQQLLQIVPQQIHQLQQLVQLLPQQLQQIQQLVQLVPQQIYQLQQQLLAQQTPFGASTPGLAGLGVSPFGNPFAWSASAQGVQPLIPAQAFGVPSPTGQVM
jgi:hypothetical protein